MGQGPTQKATDSETSEIQDLLKAIHLNMAACLLKLNKAERATQECTNVLNFDKDNTKALFRRGQAYVQQKDFYKAKADFEKMCGT